MLDLDCTDIESGVMEGSHCCHATVILVPSEDIVIVGEPDILAPGLRVVSLNHDVPESRLRFTLTW
ncbi:MAG: hypothetical protein ACR2JS_07535 [Candidatus Nanopelagicales bacterium]